MKNRNLVRELDGISQQIEATQTHAIELLDDELDDVAGGLCVGFSCGTYSKNKEKQAAE